MSLEKYTPGHRLYLRFCGSEATDRARYWHMMNPAIKADWERLAGELVPLSYAGRLVNQRTVK